MAITAAQRTLALQQICDAALTGDAAVALLLPGTTAAQVWTFIVAALGAGADARFTTILAAIVAQAQAVVAAENSQLAMQQATLLAQIQAATIV